MLPASILLQEEATVKVTALCAAKESFQLLQLRLAAPLALRVHLGLTQQNTATMQNQIVSSVVQENTQQSRGALRR